MKNDSQRAVFADGEGDAFFLRNRSKPISDVDPLLAAVARLDVRFESVLEIGAGDGKRLASFSKVQESTRFVGLDPSRLATAEGTRAAHMVRATADSLPFRDDSFDLVLFGFCLYLCDPEDYFRIASEADRVLRAPGWMGIIDFHSPEPTRVPYAHHPGVFSHKLDWRRMFEWHPSYKIASFETIPYPALNEGDPPDQLGVTILRRVGR